MTDDGHLLFFSFNYLITLNNLHLVNKHLIKDIKCYFDLVNFYLKKNNINKNFFE